MANVPDDWGCYYTKCEFCGRRYHLSEGGCDCTDDLDSCACGEREWCRDIWDEIVCSRCHTEPGETCTECEGCDQTFDPDDLTVEVVEGNPVAWCSKCYREERD